MFDDEIFFMRNWFLNMEINNIKVLHDTFVLLCFVLETSASGVNLACPVKDAFAH